MYTHLLLSHPRKSKEKWIVKYNIYFLLLVTKLGFQEEDDDSVDLDNFDIDDVPLLQGNQCLLFKITMSSE